MIHGQPPAPRYYLLGSRWYVTLTRPRSASAVARSSSRLSHGYPNRTFRPPISINSNPLGGSLSACSMQCMLGLPFGGTYASTTYQRLVPDVSRKVTTLEPKLAFHLPSCHLSPDHCYPPLIQTLRLCLPDVVPRAIPVVNALRQICLL